MNPLRGIAIILCLLAAACGPPKFEPAATQAKSSLQGVRSDYFSGPWPDNRRLNDGVLPTRNFPNPGEGSLAQTLFETADNLIKGFGLSAPMYLPLTGPIDPASLPQTPEDARSKTSALFVVNIDQASPTYGVRTPIEWQLFSEATLYLHENTLALRPVMGFPLEPSTTYAIVMTTAVHDASGAAIGQDEGMWNALVGGEHDAAVIAHYEKLLAYLGKERIDPQSVAIGVVFKTQPIMEELLLLRDYLSSLPAPSIDNVVLSQTHGNYYVFHADYLAPYLLHGEAPYQTEGGDFRYDDAGVPIVNKAERMRLTVVVPRTPMPAEGFPVVMYSHGTGGNYNSVIIDVGIDLAAEGIASVGIDQVLHGPRIPAGSSCFGQDAEICFFNPVNARAGRNLVRQAALDHVTLKKLLQANGLPAAAHPEALAVKLDPQRIGYFGHSQGGLSGALYVAIDHDLDATVISGTGGHLMTTVIQRTDPIDLRALAEGPLFLNLQMKEQIGPFHPALAILQTIGEAADPLNYARHWLKDGDAVLHNLYVTSGLDDPYTPAVGAEAMAAVAGLPQWRQGATVSPAHVLRGLEPVDGPLHDNIQTALGPVTAIFRQFPGEGHFPVFDTPAITQWRALFVDAFAGGSATIP